MGQMVKETEEVARLSVSEETYIETVRALLENHHYAAVTDIAKTLNVACAPSLRG